MFKPAVRNKVWLKAALDGPPGAGKTFTALKLMYYLSRPAGKVAGIDTENGKMRLYAPVLNEKADPEKGTFPFDVLDLDYYTPSKYIDAIAAAVSEGYEYLVIDSGSHAWQGAGGILDQKNKLDAKGGNSFTNWSSLTPQQVAFVDSIRNAPAHVIVCLRSKPAYVIEQNDKGRSVPKRVGMEPVQRDDIEYEFDLVGSMDIDHTLTLTKSRAGAAIEQLVWPYPGSELAQAIHKWLDTGVMLPLTKSQFAQKLTASGWSMDQMKALVNEHSEVSGDDKWDTLLKLALHG